MATKRCKEHGCGGKLHDNDLTDGLVCSVCGHEIRIREGADAVAPEDPLDGIDLRQTI